MSLLDSADEISRLRLKCNAKDQTLCQLKIKTKAFVDNMRQELSAEKAKVANLEAQISGLSSGISAQDEQEVDRLKKELNQVCARESDLRARAKVFADTMRSQLQAEKDKSIALEHELETVRANSGGIGDYSGALQSDKNVFDVTEELARQTREFNATKAEHERQILNLRSELEKSRQIEAHALDDSDLSRMRSELEQVTFQYQQHKIENEHLQKQLLDKDFQLEQFDLYRARAEEQESRSIQAETECQAIRQRLTNATEELQNIAGFSSHPCAQCNVLQTQLSNLSRLVSQTESSLLQSQNNLEDTRNRSELLAQKADALKQQNDDFVAQLHLKDNQLQDLRKDVATLDEHLSDLKTQLQNRQSEQQELQQASQNLEKLRRTNSALEKGNSTLISSMEVLKKEEMAKRQKAKSLVIALSSEKQGLLDTTQDQQKEIDRLRTELNQKNVENDRRLKHLNEENQQKLLQSSASARHLADEIQILKQTLTVLQESERSQQRAKALATAKREVEDSNKKRLAAKLETQKLAIELEKSLKAAQQSNESIISQCEMSSGDLDSLLEHVHETLQVVQKRVRASSNVRKDDLLESPSMSTSPKKSEETSELRGPELTSIFSPSRKDNNFFATKSAVESVFELQKKIANVVESTEQLCDLSSDQTDVSLKDILRDRMSQFMTQCFAEKVRQTYSKVDESEIGLDVAQSKRPTPIS